MRQKGFAPLVIILILIAAGAVLFGAFKFLNQGKERSFSFGQKPGQTSQKSSSGEKRNLVAIGASFTKANNLSAKLVGDNPEYSFATGTKIESVYQYLKTKGEDLSPKNLAESGANSQKVLSQQASNAVSFGPKYVLIDIMADIFEEDTPVKFKQNLIGIAKEVKNQNNTVLIGTYPNLAEMRKAGFPACSEDKLGLGVGKITEDKIKLFNGAISEVANDYGLILVDNFSVLGEEDVSDYDCLHPNIEGQKKIAKAWISVLAKGR